MAVFTGSERTRVACGLADAIQESADSLFPEGCDLLHVHDPLILRHTALLPALGLLVARGLPVLAQIHEFAEDFRPSLYAADEAYPICDYAVSSIWDREVLLDAGLELSQLHYLPDEVSVDTSFEPRSGFPEERLRDRTLVLGAHRAEGWENPGEAILLSRVLPAGADLAFAYAPGVAGLAAYGEWKSFARSRAYSIRFEEGERATLESLYRRSYRTLSTSLNGGAIQPLEGLVRGIPMLGRISPRASSDLQLAGIITMPLYRNIDIPASMIPGKDLDESLERSLSVLRGGIGSRLHGEDIAFFEKLIDALARKLSGPVIDFGALDSGLQIRFLSDLDGDPGLGKIIAKANPGLENLFLGELDPEIAIRNRRRIEAIFSPDRYGERLMSAYRETARDKPRRSIDKRKMLAGFMRPEGFSMGLL
jgi:hypothetical protein